MEEREKPGEMYISGLLYYANVYGVSIEEAAKMASDDCLKVRALEQLKPIKNALEWLQSGGKDKPVEK